MDGYERGEVARAAKTTWIVVGIVEILLGIVALAMPGIAALATTFALAILLGISGIARIVHALQMPRGSGIVGHVLLGLLAIAAGVLIIARPIAGALGLGLIVGAWCIAAGVVESSVALRRPRLPAWGWILVSGIAGILLGVLILAGWPAGALWAIGVIVGVNLLFSGIAAVAVGASVPRTDLFEPPGAPV